MQNILQRGDVAKILNCSLITVDRLRKTGKLNSFNVGDLVRFREQDVTNYIEREIETSNQTRIAT